MFPRYFWFGDGCNDGENFHSFVLRVNLCFTLKTERILALFIITACKSNKCGQISIKSECQH